MSHSSLPDFSFEKQFSVYGPVCGVDEAGRGPLAGPVVAAAVILSEDTLSDGIHDSKKLSKKQRDAQFDWVMENALATAVASASVEEIDSLNVLQATMLAMKRAVEQLPIVPAVALIDGNRAPKVTCRAECLVKGDSRSLSIAAASILAKVTRDRLMEEIDREYPMYGFARHAGYGTKVHTDALAEHGACPHHRRSFAPVKKALEAA